MDEQIMIWDTKRPKKHPWASSQYGLSFLQQNYGMRYQKYSDTPQEPNIIEVKKNVAVVVPEIIVAKKPEVTEVAAKVKPLERKVTTTKRQYKKKKK